MTVEERATIYTSLRGQSSELLTRGGGVVGQADDLGDAWLLRAKRWKLTSVLEKGNEQFMSKGNVSVLYRC